MKFLGKAVAVALVIVSVGSFSNRSVSADETHQAKLDEIRTQMETLEAVKVENEQLFETRRNDIESIGQSIVSYQERIRVLELEHDSLIERLDLLEELIPSNILQAAVLTLARAFVVLEESEVEALIQGDTDVFQKYEDHYIHQDNYYVIKEALLDKKERVEDSIHQLKILIDNKQKKKDDFSLEVSKAQRAFEETAVTLTSLSAEKNTIEEQIRKEEEVRKSTTFIWPTSGRLTSPFGYRIHPIYKTRRMHTGIDLANSSGTNIVASQNGKVTFAGRQGTYGKLIIVRHANGMETAYAHLSRISVSVGQTVSQGQSIGKMGSTGASTGSHLHFEMRKNGTVVNPMNYLK